MTEINDGGVEESISTATRTALTVAMQMGEKFSRLHEELSRDAERRATDETRALSARFDAERAVAAAELQVVNKPEWWAHATPTDIARVAETAEAWKTVDPNAAAARDIIGQEVQQRFDVNIDALAHHERMRAAAERTEAALLLAQADQLDRIAPAGPSVDVDPLNAVLSFGKEQTAESVAARSDAGTFYDSAERRDEFAASLEGKASAEDIEVRVRADVNQARPAQDVYTAPGNGRSAGAAPRGAARTRDRATRSR